MNIDAYNNIVNRVNQMPGLQDEQFLEECNFIKENLKIVVDQLKNKIKENTRDKINAEINGFSTHSDAAVLLYKHNELSGFKQLLIQKMLERIRKVFTLSLEEVNSNIWVQEGVSLIRIYPRIQNLLEISSEKFLLEFAYIIKIYIQTIEKFNENNHAPFIPLNIQEIQERLQSIKQLDFFLSQNLNKIIDEDKKSEYHRCLILNCEPLQGLEHIFFEAHHIKNLLPRWDENSARENGQHSIQLPAAKNQERLVNQQVFEVIKECTVRIEKIISQEIGDLDEARKTVEVISKFAKSFYSDILLIEVDGQILEITNI